MRTNARAAAVLAFWWGLVLAALLPRTPLWPRVAAATIALGAWAISMIGFVISWFRASERSRPGAGPDLDDVPFVDRDGTVHRPDHHHG